MPALTCYRLKSELDGNDQLDFDDYIDNVGRLTSVGPTANPAFEAKLYYQSSQPRQPAWGDFLAGGFGATIDWPLSQFTSAVLIVRRTVRQRRDHFAFTFGPAGRYLLRDDSYLRAFGLRAALNLMYPAGQIVQAPRGLRTVDSKRRSATLVRSHAQASSVTTFEVFDIDRLRDVVGGVEGRPADTATWGQRVSGGDALAVNLEDFQFSGIGALCSDIEDVARRGDYRLQFAWLDHIQPVTDPTLINRLRERTLDLVRSGDGDLELAPPEIVDWSRINRFSYPFDRRRGIRHLDLRIGDLRAVLRAAGKLDDIDYRGLHTRRVEVEDVDGQGTYKWNLWSCLAGELSLDNQTYILDEGDFFAVDPDYLSSLNRWADAIPMSDVGLPPYTQGDREDAYNSFAARDRGFLLMDKQNVLRSGATAIELCDLLTTTRKFIHVKRNAGSSDLSHLFSQGFVPAALLQDDSEFRTASQDKVREVAGCGDYDFFGGQWVTRDAEIVYAIIDHRWPTAASNVLPFFSKVNLRRNIRDLESRGYNVRLAAIEHAP